MRPRKPGNVVPMTAEQNSLYLRLSWFSYGHLQKIIASKDLDKLHVSCQLINDLFNLLVILHFAPKLLVVDHLSFDCVCLYSVCECVDGFCWVDKD